VVRRVGVVGTGLVGGSIAAGLTAAGWDVVGYDADSEAIAVAVQRGLLGIAVDSMEAVLQASPEVVIVAAPPMATIEILASLDTQLTIMDVAGVKSEVMTAAAHLPNFVGTHPMAGRETAGPKAASAALFRGANWVVVTDAPGEPTDRVVEIIRILGANPVMMSPEEHDSAVATISHLPQLLAAGLLSSADQTPRALELVAGSFRDLTRVAASQPLPWVEILKSNSTAVLAAVDALRDQLSAVEAAVLSNDDDLLAFLSTSRDLRRSLGAPVAAVRVSLADEPGEIARVGHALEESGVDLRDLQMRHAPHGGGGVLTLSVRTGEEETLRQALTDVGLETIA